MIAVELCYNLLAHEFIETCSSAGEDFGSDLDPYPYTVTLDPPQPTRSSASISLFIGVFGELHHFYKMTQIEMQFSHTGPHVYFE